MPENEWHLEVHDCHVRMQLQIGGHGLPTVGGFSDEIQVRDALQEETVGTAHQGLILHDEDAVNLRLAHLVIVVAPACGRAGCW